MAGALAHAVVPGLVLALVFGLVLGVSPAVAQTRAPPTPPGPPPNPPPSPLPLPTPQTTDAARAAGNALLDLGSNFLERLGDQASRGPGRVERTNPGGGGAAEQAEAPRYRAWFEGYGIGARTAAQGDFLGDKRTTWGGVAGIGARIAPGVNVGFTVDQSRTGIDVPLALQSASLDLTQFGFNASVDRGPWTWALALVHGTGRVGSGRDTSLGLAVARYGAHIDGALTELSYYWTRDESRIVPKLGVEYTRAATAAFQETGGLDPLRIGDASLARARWMFGAEIGRYFIFDQKILDLSAYGKFVDNFAQNVSQVLVTLGTESIAVPGIGESRYGADAGAAASLSVTSAARVYLNYDARFRAAYQSHQGTIGLEIKW